MAFVAKRKIWGEPALTEQSRLTSFDIRSQQTKVVRLPRYLRQREPVNRCKF